MKISGKLVLGFVVVALLGAAMGAFGIISMRTIDAADTVLYEKMTVPLGSVAEFVGSTNRMRSNVLMIVLNYEDAAFVLEEEKKIEGRIAAMNHAKDEYRPTILTDEGHRQLAELETLEKVYIAETAKIVALAKAGDSHGADVLAMGLWTTTVNRMNAVLGEMQTQKVALAKEQAEHNTELANSTTLLMIIVMLIITILSIVIGVVLAGSISKPLGIAVAHLGEMAQGDLRNDIPEVYLKQIGRASWRERV